MLAASANIDFIIIAFLRDFVRRFTVNQLKFFLIFMGLFYDTFFVRRWETRLTLAGQ